MVTLNIEQEIENSHGRGGVGWEGGKGEESHEQQMATKMVPSSSCRHIVKIPARMRE
jgi:hypothetical protein